jgi:hypothetical protein
VEQGEPADAAPREVLDARTARGEAAFLALRTAGGLRAKAFAAEFGALPRTFWGAEIESLVTSALMIEGPDGDLRLSPRGLLLSDSVFVSFV